MLRIERLRLKDPIRDGLGVYKSIERQDWE